VDESTEQAGIAVRSPIQNRDGPPVNCSAYGPTYDVSNNTCLAPICIVVGSGSCGPYCPGGVLTNMTATQSSNQFCDNTTASPPCPINAGGCISYAFEGLLEGDSSLLGFASALLDIVPDLTTCLVDVESDQPLFNCLGDCGGSDLEKAICIVACSILNVPSSCGQFFLFDVIPLAFDVLDDGVAITLFFIHAVTCLVSTCPTSITST
jgi:hypothetical protein